MNITLLNPGVRFIFIIFLATFISCGVEDTPDPGPADFSFEANQSTPAMVTFTNKSTYAVAYNWDFGDRSSISNEQSPTHTFPGNGEYQVTLTAIGNNGKIPGKTDSRTTSTTKTVTITNAASTLKANMKGASFFIFTANTVTGTRSADQIIVRGNDNITRMSFLEVRIPSNTTAGTTYLTKTNSLASLEYNIQSPSNNSWYSNKTVPCSMHEGTITITNVTPTTISGSFSGKVYSTDCGSFYKISQANFSADL